MKEIRHPHTLATYGIDEETGLVRVTDDNRTGLFTMNGEWRSGDVFDVDPMMCLWVGGPNPTHRYAGSFRQL